MGPGGAATGHQSVVHGAGDLRQLNQGRMPALHLQRVPLADGAGGLAPLRLLGGLGEEEAPARTQRIAKDFLAGALVDVKQARDHIGLHLRELTEGGGNEPCKAVPGLRLLRGCRHGGPPDGSRPCREHAEQAVQRAHQAMGTNPTQFQ
jgi:hypothetical protein